MRRIFSDYAYSSERIAGCFWAESVPDSRLARPALQGAQKADVAIIGAGFTGLSAALKLAQAGVNAVVLDEHFPGWGASGRNGGFCCLGGSKLEDGFIDRAFGKQARLDWRQAEKGAIELVADLLDLHRIEADRHSNGETCLAHRAARADYEGEIRRAEENYGVTPTVLGKDELAAHGMNGPFHGAITTPIGFGLNPRKYLAGLLAAAEQAGAVVHGHSPVRELSRQGNGWRVESAKGVLTCDQVIVATNGYSSEDMPDWMAGRYMPAQSSVIVTRPLTDDELAAQGWTSDQAAYDSRRLLHYFRLMPDRRFLFGMRGGLMSSRWSEDGIARQIRRDFDAMFPAWRHVETPHYWSGMVCLAADLAPFCGPVPDMPGVFAGFAYHGNGVAMGSYTGALLADVVQGKTPDLIYPEVMKKPPGRFPLGRFRRAAMFAAYAGFWFTDRFA